MILMMRTSGVLQAQSLPAASPTGYSAAVGQQCRAADNHHGHRPEDPRDSNG